MLKWAINEPRLSYLPCTPEQMSGCSLKELDHRLPTSSFRTSHSLQGQCQSMESVVCCLEPNKENQVTSSTPLHACPSSPMRRQQHKETLRIRKLDSLRDLSNIYPEHYYSQNITPQRRSLGMEQKKSENRYASTLPTLDVNEYSPSCALIPGPLLALRGLGIPDAYFEKPRYLTQQTAAAAADAAGPQIATSQVPRKLQLSPPKSLSSSQMDESTLERMIDAIIASTHKDSKLPMKSNSKHTHATSRSCSMSPTYTPAYDPASDLDELWWNTDRAFFQAHNNITLTQSSESSEHMLRTPKTHKFDLLNSAFKRRRQRPVRRKRSLKNFHNTVKKSARKLLRVGSNVSVSMPQLYEDNEDNESGTQCTPQPSRTNLSPDSGHNSSSADSSKTDDQDTKTAKEHQLTNKEAAEVEVTKRRLCFSKTHCN